MNEAEQLSRLADLIEAYIELFGREPPAPPFLPLSTLLSAYEHAVTSGERIPDGYFPGLD